MKVEFSDIELISILGNDVFTANGGNLLNKPESYLAKFTNFAV